MYMKKTNLLFLPTLLFTLFSVFQLKASVKFVDAGLSEIREMAATEGKLYFAHFSAEWCMPCQWMENNTFKDPKLSRFANQNYLAAKLDIDQSEGQWYQTQYSVANLPTILVFSSQGVLLKRIETSITAEELLSILESFNKPANKISTRPPLVRKPISKAMDSPKANFVFSRPALIPGQKDDLSKLHPGNKPVFAEYSPPITSVNPPVSRQRSNPSGSFTPKSAAASGKYYIQIGIFSSYESAVKKVNALEKDFDQPVSLYTRKKNKQLFYHVTIGSFNSKSKATNFLNYLFRNDIRGALKEKK
jgi:thiol-disulfide isomerase/thioredoxin